MSDKETKNTEKEQMECVKRSVTEESDQDAATFASSPSIALDTTSNKVVSGEQEAEAAFPQAEHKVETTSTQNKDVDVCPPQAETLVSKEISTVNSIAQKAASTKEELEEEETVIMSKKQKSEEKHESEQSKVNVMHHERLMRHLRRYRQQQQQKEQQQQVEPQHSSNINASPEQPVDEEQKFIPIETISSSTTSPTSSELEEEEEEESTGEMAQQERRRGEVRDTRLATRLSRSVSIRNRQHMMPSHSKTNRGLPSIVSLHPSNQRHQAFHNNFRRERYDSHQHPHPHQRQRQRRVRQQRNNVLHRTQQDRATKLQMIKGESEHPYHTSHQERSSSLSNSVQSNDNMSASDMVDVHDNKGVNTKIHYKPLRRRRDRPKRIKHHLLLPPEHNAITPTRENNTTESDDEQVRRVRRDKHTHADNSLSDDSRAYSLDEGEVQLRVHEMHKEREAEIEESVWREMQEIEQATQQWERMIGAMHTNTILKTEEASLSSASSSNTSKGKERNVKHRIHSHHPHESHHEHHHEHHHHHYRSESKSEEVSGGDNDNVDNISNNGCKSRNKSVRKKADESTSHASHSYQSSARKVTISDSNYNTEDIHKSKETKEKKRDHGKRSSATHKNSARSISGSSNTNKQTRGSSTSSSSSSSESNIWSKSKTSSTDTDKRPSRSSFQRMHFGVLQDPRNAIINMILSSTSGSVDIHDIHERFHWEDEYEHVYGSVAEYLQSYQAIFVTSPIDDRVTLRRARVASQIAERLRKDEKGEEQFYSHRAILARAKRSFSLVKSSEEDAVVGAAAASSNPEIQIRQRNTKNNNNRNGSRAMNRSSQHASAVRAHSSRGRSVRRRPLTSNSTLLPWSDFTLTAAAAHIGSISYSCVAEEFVLEELETIYRRRGYEVNEVCDALHIHAAYKFDLFLFSNGVVVW